jgi:hypothetical protein
MSVDEGDIGGADDPAVGVVDFAETVAERVGLTLGAALPSLGRGAFEVQATSVPISKITAATLKHLTRQYRVLIHLVVRRDARANVGMCVAGVTRRPA